MNEGSQKHRAHEFIERLQDSQIATAVRFLKFILLDPVRRALATAPPDDEPVTGHDRQRFHSGRAWFAERGEGIPMKAIGKRLRDAEHPQQGALSGPGIKFF
jgi:hypothetical protein